MKRLLVLLVLLVAASFSANAVQPQPLSDEQISAMTNAGYLNWYQANGQELPQTRVTRLSKQGNLIPQFHSGKLWFVDDFCRNIPWENQGLATKVLIATENDAASRAYAETLPFMGFGAAYNAAGQLFRAGSCVLICNNELDGAWICTSIHPIIEYATGVNYPTLKYGFGKNAYNDLGEAITAIPDKVFKNESQDIALIKLSSLVYEDDGSLATPIEFYTDSLTRGQVLLFGGFGEIGTPDQAGPQGTGYRDGFGRVARGSFSIFLVSEPSIGMMDYNTSVPLAGIVCNGDSGGPVMAEENGQLRLVGINDQIRGTGTGASSGFEYFGYNPNFFDWVNDTIAANRSDSTAPTGTVVINNNAAYTNSRIVTLTLSASDAKAASGVTEMRLSADGSTWFEWEPFATSTTWELPEGDGTKSVFVQFLDKAGNASPTYSDSIELDMTPPVVQNRVVTTHMNAVCAIVLAASGASSYQVIAAPGHGTLTGTAPALQYTPEAYFVGSDSVTFLATDVAGNGCTGTVTINVTNTAPVVSTQLVLTNMGVSVAITLGAADPDGDAITSYTVVNGPSHGTLSGSGVSRTYTPEVGWYGPDSFTVQASDGAATSNIATVNIDVAYVATTGSLVVILQPSSAVSAGRWQVDGGEWHASGETVSGLTAGAHVVTFKSIAASGRTTWKTPSSQTVNVVAGDTVQVTGTYSSVTTQPTNFFTQFIQWLLSLFGMKF